MSDRTLTDADVLTIVEALKGHSTCNLGLTPDQASILKRFLAAWDKATGIVGATVLIAFVGVVLAIFGGGFWAWIKAGGVK